MIVLFFICFYRYLNYISILINVPQDIKNSE
jgi:hypothetical protein